MNKPAISSDKTKKIIGSVMFTAFCAFAYFGSASTVEAAVPKVPLTPLTVPSLLNGVGVPGLVQFDYWLVKGGLYKILYKNCIQNGPGSNFYCVK